MYAKFRRYFGAFVDLPFAAESGSESLLDNVALLRQLNRGDPKALPPDADTSFVPVAWRGTTSRGYGNDRRNDLDDEEGRLDRLAPDEVVDWRFGRGRIDMRILSSTGSYRAILPLVTQVLV
jgi:hypothetical protein